jgi:DNA-binding transcriptional MerR regulator
MAEKRMLIVPAELVKRVDENRGDMSQADFIDFLIDSQLKEEETKETKNYITEERFHSLEQDIKKLLRSFLDFFVSYGLELGKQSPQSEFEEIASKLQGLEKELGSGSDSDKGKATIKWK